MIIEISVTWDYYYRPKCTVCSWKNPKSFYREVDARDQGALHLWEKRSDPAHQTTSREVYLERKAIERDLRKIERCREKCPTPSKRFHLTRESAYTHLQELRLRKRSSKDFNVYLCECGAWHVGHNLRHFVRRIEKSLH